MKVNFDLSPKASILLAQGCRQLRLEPETLIEELIIQLFPAPENNTSLPEIVGYKLRTIERTNQILRHTAQLQQQLQNLIN
jgi:hypothetical protein